MRRALVSIAVLITLTLLLTGCPDSGAAANGGGNGGDGGGTAGGPGYLIYARSTDATTLDPAEVLYGEDAKVTENVYETLVTFEDAGIGLVPKLATALPTISEDGKTWTFTLRQGVTFHDGTAFDAAAVVFSFERLVSADHPHAPKQRPYGPTYGVIEKVEATGDHEVVFSLKEPSAVFLQQLAMFPVGIVSPTAVKERGEDYRKSPSGTGPYKLEEWRHREKLSLVRYDGYWGEKPAIERVIFQPVSDSQTALEMLKNGEAHIVDHVTLADIEAIEKNENLYVARTPSLNVGYLAFNMNKPPYNDQKFRDAVALAIDRDALNKFVYYGLATPSKTIVPPVIWGDTSELTPYEHDLEKAKKLITEVDLGSEPIELWHMTFARPYMPEPNRVAEFVKDALSKIGLEVKLQGFEKASYTNKTKDPDHPMCLLGWNADYADPDNFLYFLLHGEAGDDLNISFWRNAEFDTKVKAAQSELDPAKRKALYARAAELYRAEKPSISLVHVPQLAAVSKAVEYEVHPIEYRLFPARFKTN